MDEYFIKKTLDLAKKAYKNGDVPVGAIIVEDGKIISQAYNKKEKNKNVVNHAEIIAISKACKKKKTTYLNDCILYVTLEPCMMCSGAIIQSHIKKVVYCTDSPKYGFMSKIDKKNIEVVNHIFEEKSVNLLKNFFISKR